MSTAMAPRKRILHFEVVTDAQAAELDAAWQEVLFGKRTRLDTAAEEINEIMERAMTGLQRILQAVEQHPGAGQTHRLVRFLAGLYNVNDYPFDLTDLRVLDSESLLHALAARLDREPDAILKEALGDLLARYEAQAFGGLVASQPPPDEDLPLVHARLLSASTTRPLCGATDRSSTGK
jgi:hypothetical protein